MEVDVPGKKKGHLIITEDVDGRVLSVERAPSRKKKDVNDRTSWMCVSSTGGDNSRSVVASSSHDHGDDDCDDMDVDPMSSAMEAKARTIHEERDRRQVQVVLDAANIGR